MLRKHLPWLARPWVRGEKPRVYGRESVKLSRATLNLILDRLYEHRSLPGYRKIVLSSCQRV